MHRPSRLRMGGGMCVWSGGGSGIGVILRARVRVCEGVRVWVCKDV